MKRICAAQNTGDLGFDCAVCLGCMCVPDRVAKQKLMGSLSSNDVNVTARVGNFLFVYLFAYFCGGGGLIHGVSNVKEEKKDKKRKKKTDKISKCYCLY